MSKPIKSFPRTKKRYLNILSKAKMKLNLGPTSKPYIFSFNKFLTKIKKNKRCNFNFERPLFVVKSI